jgi:hypothetical protein
MGLDRVANINVADGAEIERAKLASETLKRFEWPIADLKRGSNLLDLLSSDDGTNWANTGLPHGVGGAAHLHSYGQGASGSRTGRLIYTLPECYKPGGTITVRLRGRVDKIPQVAGTLDVSVRTIADWVTVGADICTTNAQSLTTSFANYDFTITPTDRTPGDELDILLTEAVDDTGGSGGAITLYVIRAGVLLTIQG